MYQIPRTQILNNQACSTYNRSADHQTYLRGPWEDFTFTLVPEPAPTITELELEFDTGESDTD